MIATVVSVASTGLIKSLVRKSPMYRNYIRVEEAVTLITDIKTSQDKIKYLKRYIILDREISRKVEEVLRLRANLEKVTSVLTPEPKGGGSIYPKQEDYITRIVDLEADINQDIDQLLNIRKEIVTTIEAVEDDRERLLLQYRYLDGYTFEWIAGDMELSWRWIHILHSKALDKINLIGS